MGSQMDHQFASALAAELAVALGGRINALPEVEAGTPTDGPQWIATIDADGTAIGSYSLALDQAATSAAVRVMAGVDGEPPTTTVIDALRQILAQTVNALASKPIARGARLHVGGLEMIEEVRPAGDRTTYVLGAPPLPLPLTMTIWGAIAFGEGSAEATAAHDAATVESAPDAGVALVSSGPAAPSAFAAPTFPSRAAPSPKGARFSTPSDRLEVILDIELPLVVRFGRTELPLKVLARLGPGSLIELGRSPDDLVDVMVSNRVVARGEVVIVGGSYGIRILHVVSPHERMPAMEA